MRQPIINVEVAELLIAFISGWILGSFSLYAYLVVTARETPYPECLDCDADSCEGCSTLAMEHEQRYHLAA